MWRDQSIRDGRIVVECAVPGSQWSQANPALDRLAKICLPRGPPQYRSEGRMSPGGDLIYVLIAVACAIVFFGAVYVQVSG